MRKPNLFIAGAPKCGTTSIAAWLSGHPRIFISDPKEPGYFAEDLGRRIYTLSSYERLFRDADATHIAVGEATTAYLRSAVAIKKILDYAPHARFIVCVRNPAEMALSMHRQKVRDGEENIYEFEEAWGLLQLRRRGRRIPKLSVDPSDLLYGDACRVGRQLAGMLRIVQRERLHVVVQDDMRVSPASVYWKTLDFLGVPDDGRSEFPIMNKARRLPKWVSLTRAVVWRTKARVGIHRGLGLLRDDGPLDRLLARSERSAPSPELWNELVNHFEPDIQILESILDRDLSHWRTMQSRLLR